MPNYNASKNSNNFGGLGPVEAGRRGGRRKGEKKKERSSDLKSSAEDKRGKKGRTEDDEEK